MDGASDAGREGGELVTDGIGNWKEFPRELADDSPPPPPLLELLLNSNADPGVRLSMSE